MSSLIPQEIVDSIFIHLRDDKSALRSCSLASRALASVCQSFIFESISLGHQQQCSVGALLSIFRRSKDRYVSKMVRTITLLDEALFDVELADLLSMSTSLVFIGLYGRSEATMSMSSIDWASIPEHGRIALESVISRPEVTGLEFINISVPIDLLGRKPSITSIRFSSAKLGVQIPFTLEKNAEIGLAEPKLPALSAIKAENLVFNMQPPDKLMNPAENNPGYVPVMLASASGTLRELTIQWKFSSKPDSLEEFFHVHYHLESLQRCTRLQTLRWKVDYVNNNMDKQFPYFWHALWLVSKVPIRNIHVEFELLFETFIIGDLAKWRQLDGAFSAMANVNIVFVVSILKIFGNMPSRPSTELVRFIEYVLPHTTASGRLTVEVRRVEKQTILGADLRDRYLRA